MLSRISWHDYWLYAGLTTLLYYLFIAAVYFRTEMLALLSWKSKPAVSPHVPVTAEPTDQAIDDIKQEDNVAYQPLSEAKEADALEVMEAIAGQLATVMGEFGATDINKEAFTQRLILTIHNYGHSDIIYPFRETLRQYIREQANAINRLMLDSDDLYRIVPERKTDWKQGLTLLLAVLIAVIAKAQDGNAGISEATTKVKSYFTAGCNLMYAIGAVVGLVGAVKVFNKWNSGEPDTGRVAAAWFGSCIFLVVVATVLKSFFNV